MDNKRVYYIPPNLNRSYLLGGFKIMELVAFLVIAVISLFMVTKKGFPTLTFVIPALYLVLHLRALPDGRNVQQALAMRWRYFQKDQRYSLQECEKRK